MVKVNTERLVADAGAFHKFEMIFARENPRLLKQSGDLFPGQREDALFFRAVIEGAEGANFFEAPHRVQRVEKLGITRG
jgi:hypothetical protein